MKIHVLKKIFALAFLVGLLPSCSSEPESGQDDSAFPGSIDYSTLDTRSVEAILAFDEPFMEAVTQYWNTERKDNAAVSPFSAASVMCMIANGANAEGRSLALKTFGLEGSDLDVLNSTMSSIMTSMVHNTPKSKLMITNSAWAHDGNNFTVTFEESYAETIKKYFNANIGYTDLQTTVSDLLQHPLNKWASQSLGKDYNFFVPYSECYIVLANILNFEADWKEEFKPEDTTLDIFNNLDGTNSNTDFLVGKQTVNYAECDLGKYIELYYKNSSITFKIFVPETARFSDVNYSVFDWQKMHYKISNGETLLHMPKFDLNIKNELGKVVIAMGLEKLFRDQDSFSAMAKTTSENKDLGNFLKFDQDINVTVDEKGSKAVVVSSASNWVTSSLDNTPDEIFVDSPFLFEISAYGQTIVAGRITRF